MQLKRRYDIYLQDILNAIERIQEYTDGMEYDTFVDTPLVRDAVFWNLQVIGEAVGQLPATVKEEHNEVPWRDVRDFRNIVVHKYWEIDTRLVWEIIEDRLPALQRQISSLL